MNSSILTVALLFGVFFSISGQTRETSPSTTPIWTEEDRHYLLENLNRSKKELLDATENLTEDQWNFKESPDAWSISQIVEHIGLYELIFTNDIAVAFQIGPLPEFPHYAPDSVFLDQDPFDLKKNTTTDYTQPFTYTVPLGNNPGSNNVIWVTKMRQEIIDFVTATDKNLRIFYINFGPNVHQKCIMIFTHNDRHLRQITRVKSHPDYPE
jgi:hypothetical protein